MFAEAFGVGVLSAISLPLGTLAAMVWRPGNRVLAFLMAFGAGGLLAALTVDLVDHALDNGHFKSLAIGCIAGGLLFVALNNILNKRGGFLRKASTTLTYSWWRRTRHLRNILEQVERLPVFHGLPSEELDRVAAGLQRVDYPAGTTIFRRGDPCGHLNIVESGRVRLFKYRRRQTLGPGAAFAHRSFFTGLPHTAAAVADSDVSLWRLPRPVFDDLLPACAGLEKKIENWLRTDSISYYRERKQIGISTVQDSDAFIRVAQSCQRFPLFQNLPAHVLAGISRRAFRKEHERGHMFFHAGDTLQRMYIIEEGEVVLMSPGEDIHSAGRLGPGDAFGHLVFLSGDTCTRTAVAVGDVRVWVVRRQDFNDFLRRSSDLRERLADYLKTGRLSDYLVRSHGVARDRASSWEKQAIRHLGRARNLPKAPETSAVVAKPGHVATAIWLGCFLDGIPESLVIGAGMMADHLSLALIGGVFISNFPEALSSSVSMHRHGMSWLKVLSLWSSITLTTGIGVVVGTVFSVEAPPWLIPVIQGVAAGSMLTVIAETMLPEAYTKGGTITGLSTLLGFLTTIGFSHLAG